MFIQLYVNRPNFERVGVASQRKFVQHSGVQVYSAKSKKIYHF